MRRLLPETQFPSAGLSRHYLCGRPWDRDWQRVGEDIFRALITVDPRDSSSAPGTKTSHPARRRHPLSTSGESLLSESSSRRLFVPELLGAYERILPGAADPIIQMPEEEGRHWRSPKNRGADANIGAMRRQLTEARLGQSFAFLIAVMFIASGTYLVSVKDNTAVGLLSGAVALEGLVSTFVWGRWKHAHKEDKGNSK
ncbi:MAG: DUF2335 domain-containing protein [Bryobacteraceae bacterium]